jgi:hypothetical protein
MLGGAFGNDDEWIHAAIRGAVRKAQEFDLDVRLVSYRVPSAEVQELLRDFQAPQRPQTAANGTVCGGALHGGKPSQPANGGGGPGTQCSGPDALGPNTSAMARNRPDASNTDQRAGVANSSAVGAASVPRR